MFLIRNHHTACLLVVILSSWFGTSCTIPTLETPGETGTEAGTEAGNDAGTELSDSDDGQSSEESSSSDENSF